MPTSIHATTVTIAIPNAALRAAVTALLAARPEIEVAGAGPDLGAATATMPARRARVTVAGACLLDGDLRTALAALRERVASPGLVVYGFADAPDYARLAEDADAYWVDEAADPEALVAAVLAAGAPPGARAA